MGCRPSPLSSGTALHGLRNKTVDPRRDQEVRLAAPDLGLVAETDERWGRKWVCDVSKAFRVRRRDSAG